MKVALLALALAAALPLTAHAKTQPDYAIGVRATALNGPAWTVKVSNPRLSPVRMSMILDQQMLVIADANDKGQAIAKTIAHAYAYMGSAMVRISVDQTTHTVSVVEGTTKGSTGAYPGYLRATDHATQRQIAAAARKMADRARADRAHAEMTVGKVDDQGQVAVSTSETPVATAPVSGSAGFTNAGARYAGADLITASMRADLGHGNELDLSAAHGLSNMSSDSFGGRYNAAGASLTHFSSWGGTRFYANNVDYLTGGPLRPYDLSGRVSTWGVQQIVPLSQRWTAYGGLQWTIANERIGAVAWTDHERYLQGQVGFTYQGDHTTANIEWDKGLDGSRDYTAQPLQGPFDPHFSSVHASLSSWTPIGDQGWVARGGVAGQLSGHNTPTNELFTIGGPQRGLAYLSGYAAGRRGYALWGQVETPTWHDALGYVGVDRASVKSASGASYAGNSLYAGVRYHLNQRLTLDMGYAHSLGAAPVGQEGHRVFATLNVAF